MTCDVWRVTCVIIVKISSGSMKHVGVGFDYGHAAIAVLQAKCTGADAQARDV